jgi:hypothetical protein
MLKAADLSNPTWQSQVTDEQIRASIIGGKNAMPAFGNLPPDTVENLVWLVRWFNSDQTAIQARMAQLKGQTGTAAGAPSSSPTSAGGRAPSIAPTSATAGSTAPRPAVTGATGGAK